MFKSIIEKCCISLLMVVVIIKSCVAGRMDRFANKAAFVFAEKWLANPKMYIGIILPNKCPLGTLDALKLTRKIAKWTRPSSEPPMR